MGCKLAPALANIFMYDLEKVMLQPYQHILDIWRRYVDDIFFVWIRSLTKLKEFMDHCNGFHPSIKYTFTYSTSEVDFMDVKVFRDKNGKLQTTVFRKATQRNTYLHRSSFHSSHIFRNIIYNQARRIRSINSSNSRFKKQLKQLRGNFYKRGYVKEFCDSQLQRANRIPNNKLKPRGENNPKLICRLSHNINNKYRKQAILKIWDEFTNINTNTSSPSIVFVIRNHPNLKKLLVRARTKSILRSVSSSRR